MDPRTGAQGRGVGDEHGERVVVLQGLKAAYSAGSTVMDLLTQRLENFLRKSEPYAYCAPSLAAVLAVREEEVRCAAQVLLTASRVRVEGFACHFCQREDEVGVIK